MVHLQVIQGEAATDAELAELEAVRPKKRGHCEGGTRPCPFLSCRHHLLINHESTNKVLRIAGRPGGVSDDDVLAALFSMEDTCALDVVGGHDGDALSLSEVGRRMRISRERIRQIIRDAAPALGAGLSIRLEQKLTPLDKPLVIGGVREIEGS